MTRVVVALLMVIAGGCVPPTNIEPDPTVGIESPLDGVVLSVESEGLGQVRSFTLRPARNPSAFTFTLGTLENPTEFPPSHLAEHQLSSEPVRVYFVTDAGEHIVYRLEDAPG